MTPDISAVQDSSSFRDPAGFVFHKGGRIFRQINNSGAEDYVELMNSGLYQSLVDRKWLVSHQELSAPHRAEFPNAFKVIEPEKIPFVSYPYEWSFSQLKDAALLTLWVQLAAMEKGMSLKDASAYNIQFSRGLPVFIDTLSFEKYIEGTAWVAFGQFSRHFLAPLSLMKYADRSLLGLFRSNIDGVPPSLASKLLPFLTWFKPVLFFNIHLRAISPEKSARQREVSSKVSKTSLVGALNLLESCIRDLNWKPKGTVWAEYYSGTNYTSIGFVKKQELIATYLDIASPSLVCDYGANDGTFSRLAARRKILTISVDMDPAVVEQNYLRTKESGEQFLLPLLVDLVNPSPAMGWNHKERDSFLGRVRGGMAMMLALVHHLFIGNNIPFHKMSEMIAALHDWLIIEFVPREDSQVQTMLVGRKDIYSEYTQANFEETFATLFEIVRCDEIPDSRRRLYLMKNRNSGHSAR